MPTRLLLLALSLSVSALPACSDEPQAGPDAGVAACDDACELDYYCDADGACSCSSGTVCLGSVDASLATPYAMGSWIVTFDATQCGGVNPRRDWTMIEMVNDWPTVTQWRRTDYTATVEIGPSGLRTTMYAPTPDETTVLYTPLTGTDPVRIAWTNQTVDGSCEMGPVTADLEAHTAAP